LGQGVSVSRSISGTTCFVLHIRKYHFMEVRWRYYYWYKLKPKKGFKPKMLVWIPTPLTSPPTACPEHWSTRAASTRTPELVRIASTRSMWAHASTEKATYSRIAATNKFDHMWFSRLPHKVTVSQQMYVYIYYVCMFCIPLYMYTYEQSWSYVIRWTSAQSLPICIVYIEINLDVCIRIFTYTYVCIYVCI